MSLIQSKTKAAFISLLLKIIFTIIKFITFYMTGSIAILAEAWHSFTDILTSILVLFSVIDKKNDVNNSTKLNFFKKLIDILPDKNREVRVSVFISMVLFLISISIFEKTIFYNGQEIKNSLLVGLVFIFFSFCSYAIYKYEDSVGRKEKSPALISDGMHSRADTVSSLLAGFSLILYSLGYNIDRLMAGLIGLFILLSAVEIIINIALSDKKDTTSFHYGTLDIVNLIFNKNIYKKLFISIDNFFHFGLKKHSQKLKTIICYTLTILILSLYTSTCFFTVDPTQQGIIERFGKPVSSSPVEPGLGFKFPWPIDKLVKVESKIIHKINIGNISDKNTFALIWAKEHGTEEAFLTADNNFFFPYFSIHFKISNIFYYVYNHNNPIELLDNISHDAISLIFAKKTFDQIVTAYRHNLEFDCLKQIQNRLDELKSGIEIVSVNIKDMHPPIFISDSFEDVIAAVQYKEKRINEAIDYKNRNIPSARADAYKQITKAESYVFEKNSLAEGESARFLNKLEIANQYPDTTLKITYLNNLADILKDKKKILIDPAAGIPQIWMDFDDVYNRNRR